MPSNPVVKSRISVSCTLTKARINTEEKNTIKPREMFITADIAIGKVLRGLNANPIVGRNIGAAWNSTVIVVNMAPVHINLLIFIFFNINASYQVI